MTPHEFIAKWRKGGDERQEWHSFFGDLCRLVGHSTPREADETVAAAYGWEWPLTDDEILRRLFELNQRRVI